MSNKTASKTARVSFVPFFPRLGDLEHNFKEIVRIIKELKGKSDIIIFPELASSGYLLENLVISSAIELPNGLPEELVDASDGVEVILGVLLKESGTIYNAAVVLKDKKVHHVHKKIYLPTYGLFDETRYCSPGNDLITYEGTLGKCAVLICEDAFHPALAYATYAAGAEHVFVPSCSPTRGITEDEPAAASYLRWRKRLEVYSESFGQFYYYVNRSGSEDGVYFDGKSIYVSPNRDSSETLVWHDKGNTSGTTTRSVEDNTTEKRDNESQSTSKEKSETEVNTIEVHLSDSISAFRHGGPFQHENWDLNKRILDKMHKIHEPPNK